MRNDAGEFLFDDEDLEGLGGFYRLLSRLWVAEIDQEWLEALTEGSLSDVARDLAHVAVPPLLPRIAHVSGVRSCPR